MLLFLNELSCNSYADENAVDAGMKDFVDVVRNVRRKRKETALITPSPLPHLELSRGYHMQQWINKPENRDRWRLIQSARNVAPAGSVVLGSGEVEYTHLGRLAKGLGGAHLLDGLAVSLPMEPDWKTPWIAVDRCQAVENNDGDLDLESDKVQARHASCGHHAGLHGEWIAASGLAGLTTGVELRNSVADFFPHLRFLPRAEKDLADLKDAWLRPVRDRLLELEAAVSEWDPKRSPQPQWRSDVTPESMSRKSLCDFTDVDGVVRTFDMHARFTPGAGRLHFRLNPEEGMLTVAYIGRKLGI